MAIPRWKCFICSSTAAWRFSSKSRRCSSKKGTLLRAEWISLRETKQKKHSLEGEEQALRDRIGELVTTNIWNRYSSHRLKRSRISNAYYDLLLAMSPSPHAILWNIAKTHSFRGIPRQRLALPSQNHQHLSIRLNVAGIVSSICVYRCALHHDVYNLGVRKGSIPLRSSRIQILWLPTGMRVMRIRSGNIWKHDK